MTEAIKRNEPAEVTEKQAEFGRRFGLEVLYWVFALGKNPSEYLAELKQEALEQLVLEPKVDVATEPEPQTIAGVVKIWPEVSDANGQSLPVAEFRKKPKMTEIVPGDAGELRKHLRGAWMAISEGPRVEVELPRGQESLASVPVKAAQLSYPLSGDKTGTYFIGSLVGSVRYGAKLKPSDNLAINDFKKAFGDRIALPPYKQTLMLFFRPIPGSRAELIGLGKGDLAGKPFAFSVVINDKEIAGVKLNEIQANPVKELKQLFAACFGNKVRKGIVPDDPSCVPFPFDEKNPVTMMVKQAS